jgi:flavin reductase (DIM6/NTAB) family NADH-FMN oxidoreductase RutF
LFDFETMAAAELYKLLPATILPGPIAWITTRDACGLVNAAPFSFFNVFGSDPATVGVGIGSRSPGQPKDTRANIRANEQFVVNLVPFSLAQQMRITSIAFPKGIDESREAGLALTPSERVAVPPYQRCSGVVWDAWKAASTPGRPNVSRCRTFLLKSGGASIIRDSMR